MTSSNMHQCLCIPGSARPVPVGYIHVDLFVVISSAPIQVAALLLTPDIS